MMENWYYVLQGERQGPVEREHVQRLLDAGDIDGESLVWNDSMENWEPAANYFNVSSTTAAEVASSPSTPPPADADVSSGGACSECGMVFPKGELSNFGGKPTCKNCLGKMERQAQSRAAQQQRANAGNRRPTPAAGNGSNSMAVTGFIMSITSIACCCILAIPGLICSFMGYQAADQNNGQGKGLALAGIIISIASIVLNLIVFLFAFIGGMAEGSGY